MKRLLIALLLATAATAAYAACTTHKSVRFYDALLADAGHAPPTVGLAFDEQIVGHIPREAHDTPVSLVVTPTRVLRVSEARAI